MRQEAQASSTSATTMEESEKAGFRDSATLEYIQIIGVAFIIVFGFIRPFIVEPYKIPSGSMEDTLFPGDRVLVVKFLYGVKLPGTSRRLFAYRKPKRGDVFVFSPKHQPHMHFIKRIVALEGDTVRSSGRRLFVNDQPVLDETYTKHTRAAMDFPPFRYLVPYFFESPETRGSTMEFAFRDEVRVQVTNGKPAAFNLHGSDTYRVNRLAEAREWDRNIPVKSYYAVDADNGARHMTGYLYQNTNSKQWFFVRPKQRSQLPDGGRNVAYRVPTGHFWAMGDNRGNSEDSRAWGAVPFDVVKGRAVFIYWSTDPNEAIWNLPKWLRIGRIGRIERQYGRFGR